MVLASRALRTLMLTLVLLYLAFIVILVAAGMAHAHDIYTRLYSGGAPGVGQWCCSGDPDPAKGDCEAVGSDYQMQPDGSAIFTSRRWGVRKVHVAADKITWLPVPGGEGSEAHWCGKPRSMMLNPPPVGEQDQIDPETWTYCAFIVPGGV